MTADAEGTPWAGTLIGLIRGINVGRAKRVAMADLRALVTDLGFTHVRTLLNSGNVVFSTPAGAASGAGSGAVEGSGALAPGGAGPPGAAPVPSLATAPPAAAALLEEGLVERLGVRARVVVVTAGELAEIVEENPRAADVADPSRLLVAFVADRADLSLLAPLTRRDWTPEALAVGRRAAYLWCPDGVAGSPLAKAAGEALGEAVTMRNWATVLKLRDLSGIGG